MRSESADIYAGRSINLIMSSRGINALNGVGLTAEVLGMVHNFQCIISRSASQTNTKQHQTQADHLFNYTTNP